MAITGNASAALELSVVAISGQGGASASLSFNAAATGVNGISGIVSAGMELSAAAYEHWNTAKASLSFDASATGVIGIAGNARCSMEMSSNATMLIGIVGDGSASVEIDVTPVIFFGVSGDASASLSLSASAVAALSDLFQSWAVNTKTLGPAQYTNFGFNSLFKGPGGFYYGCNSQGIFRLTSKKDEGANIDAVIVTGISDYGATEKKRFPDAYFQIRNEGEMEVSVIIDEKTRRNYTVSAFTGQEGIHTKRLKMAKGIEGHHIQLEIRNKNGSDFDLEKLEIVPEVLKRT